MKKIAFKRYRYFKIILLNAHSQGIFKDFKVKEVYYEDVDKFLK